MSVSNSQKTLRAAWVSAAAMMIGVSEVQARGVDPRPAMIRHAQLAGNKEASSYFQAHQAQIEAALSTVLVEMLQAEPSEPLNFIAQRVARPFETNGASAPPVGTGLAAVKQRREAATGGNGANAAEERAVAAEARAAKLAAWLEAAMDKLEASTGLNSSGVSEEMEMVISAAALRFKVAEERAATAEAQVAELQAKAARLEAGK